MELQFFVPKIVIWLDPIQRIQVTKHRIIDSSDSLSDLCYLRLSNRTSNCSEKCMRNTNEMLESLEIPRLKFDRYAVGSEAGAYML